MRWRANLISSVHPARSRRPTPAPFVASADAFARAGRVRHAAAFPAPPRVLPSPSGRHISSSVRVGSSTLPTCAALGGPRSPQEVTRRRRYRARGTIGRALQYDLDDRSARPRLTATRVTPVDPPDAAGIEMLTCASVMSGPRGWTPRASESSRFIEPEPSSLPPTPRLLPVHPLAGTSLPDPLQKARRSASARPGPPLPATPTSPIALPSALPSRAGAAARSLSPSL